MINFSYNKNMNDTFSQINIYEKGESQNAFPIKIWFELDFSNSP